MFVFQGKIGCLKKIVVPKEVQKLMDIFKVSGCLNKQDYQDQGSFWLFIFDTCSDLQTIFGTTGLDTHEQYITIKLCIASKLASAYSVVNHVGLELVCCITNFYILFK